MISKKIIVALLIGVAFLFAACQTPVEPTTPPTTETPPVEVPVPPVTQAASVTVNGDTIPAERVQQTQEQLQQFTGEPVSTEEATQYLIEETLLLQEARERGLEPTIQEVETEIEEQLAMQGMSREELQAALSEEEYQQLFTQQQNQMSIQALQQDLAPQPTDEEIAEVYEQNRELFEAEGISEEEARDDIITFLAQAQGQEALAALLEELLANAQIQ